MDALLKFSFDYLAGLTKRWDELPVAEKQSLMTYYMWYNWLFRDLNTYDSIDVKMDWEEYESQEPEETLYENYPSCELAPDFPIQMSGIAGATLRATYNGYTLRICVYMGKRNYSHIDAHPMLYANHLQLHVAENISYCLTASHDTGWLLGTWHPLMNMSSPLHAHEKMNDPDWCNWQMHLVHAFNEATQKMFRCHLYKYRDGAPNYALNTLFYSLMEKRGYVD